MRFEGKLCGHRIGLAGGGKVDLLNRVSQSEADMLVTPKTRVKAVYDGRGISRYNR